MRVALAIASVIVCSLTIFPIGPVTALPLGNAGLCEEILQVIEDGTEPGPELRSQLPLGVEDFAGCEMVVAILSVLSGTTGSQQTCLYYFPFEDAVTKVNAEEATHTGYDGCSDPDTSVVHGTQTGCKEITGTSNAWVVLTTAPAIACV